MKNFKNLLITATFITATFLTNVYAYGARTETQMNSRDAQLDAPIKLSLLVGYSSIPLVFSGFKQEKLAKRLMCACNKELAEKVLHGGTFRILSGICGVTFATIFNIVIAVQRAQDREVLYEQ